MELELAVLMARWQFAVTTLYHFIFVPITIGLAPILAIMHTLYYVTNNDKYRRMTIFFGKLFLINFALGLVTGITQEFQFGMNWSSYSRYAGDIFGAPLAMEALLAFFLESTFLGLWMFGWKYLPPKLHLMCIWLVAAGTWFSSLFILAANSFMQNPVGYIENAEKGRLELGSFAEVMTNPLLPFMFGHVITAALCTAGVLVVGVSAYHLLRKTQPSLFERAMAIGLIVTFVASLATAGIGHAQAQQLLERQPVKLAAAEAQWKTMVNPPLTLFSVIDTEAQENHFEVGIPGLLSFLATDQFGSEMKGLKDLQQDFEAEFGPGNYLPDVPVVYWSFRVMVGLGTLMILYSAVGLFLWRRKAFADGGDTRITRLWLRFAIPALSFGVLACGAGWLFTEAGRQPWLVYKKLLTVDGISVAVPSWQVITTLSIFTLVYGALAVAEFYLMYKYTVKGPDEPESLPGHEGGELVSDVDGPKGTSATDRPITPVVHY
ncbi:cytochrome ubiquinol oxidase subunit I [Stomatohabitans albus]|uniref:cytochrome ubiquinol oxidase subunit I n=1 Tax=Stomatohabitans albus TaxID=3110766 RepID=UPI00300C3341